MALSVVFMLTACGGDGKNGSASDNNLLSTDYIFVDPDFPIDPIDPVDPDDPTNTTPVADAGNNQDVSSGTQVTLNGSGSHDADGDPLTYKWIIAEKPSESTAVLSGETNISPTFTTDKDGHYRVELVVNDGKVNSLSDSVFITVNAPVPKNTPPNAVAEGPSTFIVKRQSGVHEIVLDGSNSTDDGLINPLTYTWASGPFIAKGQTIHAKPSCSDNWQHCYNAEQIPLCSFNIDLTVFDGEFSDTDTLNLKIDYSDCTVEVPTFTLLLTPTQDITMYIGDTTQLTVAAQYSSGLTKGVTQDAKWISSDSSVSSVGEGSEGGIVTAKAVGVTHVTAVYEGVTSNIKKITVEGKDKTIQNVQITPNNITLTKGTTQQYHVDVIYTDLSLKDITSEVQIKSLDTSVVTIDANNIATAVGIGSSPVGGFGRAELTTTYQGIVSEREFVHVQE